MAQATQMMPPSRTSNYRESLQHHESFGGFGQLSPCKERQHPRDWRICPHSHGQVEVEEDGEQDGVTALPEMNRLEVEL